MSDAESEATVYGYSSDEEQHSYNIDTKNFYRGPTGYARRELFRVSPAGNARLARICTFLGPLDLIAFAASTSAMTKIAMADALWDALTARAFPTSVRRSVDGTGHTWHGASGSDPLPDRLGGAARFVFFWDLYLRDKSSLPACQWLLRDLELYGEERREERRREEARARAERLAALPAQLARRPTVRLVVMHFVEDEGRAAALVRNLKMRLGYFGIDVDEDVRDLDDQDFRRVTDLVVSYADENDLRYGSLSLEGIDGMALAARLRDVASRPA